jgi:hypothetical protein
MAALARFEEFKNTAEYKLWGNLKEICESLNISDSSIS